MFSAIWANQYQGFSWIHNKSSDLETMAVASLGALGGAIMIMKFNSKTTQQQ